MNFMYIVIICSIISGLIVTGLICYDYDHGCLMKSSLPYIFVYIIVAVFLTLITCTLWGEL